MPARYPNLLVNGTSGIAVGMATNIPPHNLREVVSAIVKIIDNIIEEDRTTDLEEILGIVKGPDFPTGAEISAPAASTRPTVPAAVKSVFVRYQTSRHCRTERARSS